MRTSKEYTNLNGEVKHFQVEHEHVCLFVCLFVPLFVSNCCSSLISLYQLHRSFTDLLLC